MKLKQLVFKMIVLLLALFISVFIGSFLIVFSMLNVFVKFDVISFPQVLRFSGILSLILSVITCYFQLKLGKREKKSKISNWFHHNSSRLIVSYIFLLIFLNSIRPELIWTLKDAKNILSLEWTLVGISITIFLVWNVIIKEYLKDKEPQEPKTSSLFGKYKYINEKRSFYKKASNLFTSTTLLSVNLFVLIIITSIIHITSKDFGLIDQTCIIFSFYLCTNTLVDLFMGVLIPINEDKQQKLTAATVTNADVNFQNRFIEDVENFYVLIGQLDKLQGIDEEQKKIIREKALMNLLGIENIQKPEPIKEERENDQL